MLHQTDHFTTFIDAPTGFGKTHRMLQSLRPDRKYLLVTPRISETYRFADRDEDTGEMLPMEQRLHPDVEVHLTKTIKGTKMQPRSKTAHLKVMLEEGKSVAITHALFDRLKDEADAHLLAGYDIVIDENPEPITTKSVTHRKTLNELLIQNGYAEVDEKTDQLVPLRKWVDLETIHYDTRKDEWVSTNALEDDLFQEAKAGRLVCHDDTLFVVACPPQVLLGGRSLTVLTFMCEGGYFYHYLKKLGEKHPTATPHVQRYMTAEFIRRATEMVTAEVMPTSIRKMGYKAQMTLDARGRKRLGNDIRNFLRGSWSGDCESERLAVVCAKSKWHAGTKRVTRDVVLGDGSKVRRCVTVYRPSDLAEITRVYKKATYVSSKTRGINGLNYLNRMLYCYDMHPNPKVADFLGCNGTNFSEKMAVAEAVQVIWRMAVRKYDDPEPVKVAFASKRMHTLFTAWQQSLSERPKGFTDDFAVIEDAA